MIFSLSTLMSRCIRFVLIGGTACHLNLEEQGLPFRTTKDLDIVLLLDMEMVDKQFTQLFWEFIRNGRYTLKQRSSGKPLFYRFEKPENKAYPFMIELFSRKLENLELHGDSQCTPIPAEGELSSLSAILLTNEYYDLIRSSLKKVNGVNIVTPVCLIALKARAYLDLNGRKSKGEDVDSDKIKKHKNDVFRISLLVSPENHIVLAPLIRDDLKKFVDLMRKNPPDLKSLGIKSVTTGDILDLISNVFGIS